VLLLDEPQSNLDAQLRVSLRGEIRRVQEETGVTTLHVTHDQSEALALGHRVAVLRDGHVEQVGTPDDVWERPASTWVARFVGTPPMNLLTDGDAIAGFRAEDATCRVADDGGYVFELAERTGADRLWHLRAGEDAIVVRAPEDADAPPRGARVDVTVAPHRIRRFDPVSGTAIR
jgi:sn-glycerol 3-phosphate transport system ATP-binding protein